MTEAAKAKILKRRAPQSIAAAKTTGNEEAKDSNPIIQRDVSLLTMTLKAASRERLVGLLIIALGFLLVLLFTLNLFRTNHYFAVDANGRAIEIRPLDSPVEVAGAAEGFVNRALPDIFTFGFINYQDHLYNAQRDYFTARGAEQLSTVLDRINLATFMEGEYSIKLLVVGSGPRILEQGNNSDGYYYVVDTNVDVFLDPPGQENRPRLNEWVVRVVFYVANDNDSGFRIDQFLVQAR